MQPGIFSAFNKGYFYDLSESIVYLCFLLYWLVFNNQQAQKFYLRAQLLKLFGYYCCSITRELSTTRTNLIGLRKRTLKHPIKIKSLGRQRCLKGFIQWEERWRDHKRCKPGRCLPVSSSLDKRWARFSIALVVVSSWVFATSPGPHFLGLTLMA